MKTLAMLFLAYCLIALYRTPGRGYGAKVLMFFDLFVCACIWRLPDVTISSKCGLELRRANPRWWAVAISAFCDLFEPNHCKLAIQADRDRAAQAIALLTGNHL
jgi:hypothetical protein